MTALFYQERWVREGILSKSNEELQVIELGRVLAALTKLDYDI